MTRLEYWQLENESSAAYRDARYRLQDVMRRNDHTQTSLAEIMGISQSALSQRLKKDNPQIFMDIASAFPAAGDVTATLLTDLAEIYHNLFLENLNIALANGDDAARAARDWLEKNGREKE